MCMWISRPWHRRVWEMDLRPRLKSGLMAFALARLKAEWLGGAQVTGHICRPE